MSFESAEHYRWHLTHFLGCCIGTTIESATENDQYELMQSDIDKIEALSMQMFEIITRAEIRAKESAKQ